MSVKLRIAAATSVMAFATLLSRIAGLARDMVVARMFGAGFASDAFFMAFTIPNLLRRFFGEGSLTAAFVPTFSEVYFQQDAKQTQQFVNRCFTLLLLVMIVVVCLGIVGSPLIVKGIGYGFAQVEGKLQLTDQLSRLMFPYIGLISLLALVTGILNVCGHFFLPSLSPLFLNLAMIFSALTLSPLFPEPIYALAIGVLLGGVGQLLLQVPVLIKYRIRLRFDFNFQEDSRLRKVVRLMLPGIAGVAIYQVNVIVGRLLASFLPEGSVSYLYYAQRLFEFPQGIFIVSLAQAALPMMSRQLAEGDQRGMHQSLRFALSLITIFCLPAIVGLVLCATPVYSLFFMGGEFDLAAMKNTAMALICYAPGLMFVGYSRIAAQTFYAMQDTRTPVVVSFWTLLVNFLLGLILMQYLQHLGLAVALTLASLFNAVTLPWLLRRRVGPLVRGAILWPLLKLIPACLLMAVVVQLILSRVDWSVSGDFMLHGSILLAAVAAGALAFAGVGFVLRIEELHQGWRLLTKRRSDTT